MHLVHRAALPGRVPRFHWRRTLPWRAVLPSLGQTLETLPGAQGLLCRSTNTLLSHPDCAKSKFASVCQKTQSPDTLAWAVSVWKQTEMLELGEK